MQQETKSTGGADHSGGLYTYRNFFAIPDNGSPRCIDVKFNVDGSVEKRLGSTTLNATVLVSSAATGFAPDAGATLGNGLVAFWKLNEQSGTRAAAFSSNDLTDNNTVTFAAGILGNAAVFTSANSEYLSRASNSDLALGTAAEQVRGAIRKVGLPAGYTSRFSGTVKTLDDTNRSLIITFLLACIFMYMVLAAQFESLLHPLAIMMSLPMSIPFALLTLWMTGRTLNLWSSLGVLLLLGIVKKNGILQIDYANRLRSEGMPLREAVLEACQVRLRPILMTTFSIIGGLIPTAIGGGAGAAQRSAIAVTIIGGQTLCLLLTLIITPVTYSLLSDLRVVAGFIPRLRQRKHEDRVAGAGL